MHVEKELTLRVADSHSLGWTFSPSAFNSGYYYALSYIDRIEVRVQ